jgi:hypothetical protein
MDPAPTTNDVTAALKSLCVISDLQFHIGANAPICAAGVRKTCSPGPRGDFRVAREARIAR